MKNSEISKKTRPLKDGEILQENDLYWSINEKDEIQWLEIPEEYYGTRYEAHKYVPMRRPITQAISFIKEEN